VAASERAGKKPCQLTVKIFPDNNGFGGCAVAKLKELKSMQKQGLITEAQYQAESQKILNQLVE
jgi:hypothetical protein